MSGKNKNTETFQVLHYDGTAARKYEQDLIREEPLLIRVGDKPYSVVMRTPGDEISHGAGFCLAEGLVDDPGDFATIGYCDDMDENSVTVILQEARKKKVSGLLDRQGFISQTSCGICGRDMIEDLCRILTPVTDGTTVSVDEALLCVEKFIKHQEYYERTRGSHAVMLFDSVPEIIAKAEDVGRHNAMDKAIGGVFLKGELSKIRLAVLSSRISFEMVQKAARARIPILVSISHPTSMAVDLAGKLNMTLTCIGKESGLMVLCGEERLRGFG